MNSRAPLRVLMTTDSLGGVWQFTLQLVEELVHQDVQIGLAVLGRQPSKSQIAQVAEIGGVTLFSSNFKLEWMEDPWLDVTRSGQWLLALEQEYSPNLIHLNSLVHGALPWRAPFIVTAHSCVVSWWKAVHGCEAPSSWDRYRREVRMSLHSADVVITPSESMADSLVENYSLSRSYCSIIPNGRARDRFRCVAKEPFVFSAGRLWDLAKNSLALARAAPNVRWPVVLAGDITGPSDQPTSFPGCQMLGVLPEIEMADLLARASIYAAPALYEPFGLAILEAALSGCALIVGDIPSLREIWEDAALYVSPNDHHALAQTINRIIEDVSMLREMSLRSYQRALRFSPDRMTQSYLETYQASIGIRNLQCAS